MGCNSPVIWVAVAGLYRCDVAHNLTTEKCTTKLINVIYDVTNEGLYSHFKIMLSVFFSKEVHELSSLDQPGSNITETSRPSGSNLQATHKPSLGNTTAGPSGMMKLHVL